MQRRLRVYRVIIKGKFKERPINLAKAVNLMFGQKFSGSIRKEHVTWWKQYWIKPIYLQIIYPKSGWITLAKIYREGKPSIRVITMPTSSTKRELLVYDKLYGKED
tara:strand:- start:421 stop:738 length:318 start_codon:yes stop_codon:yes gene_type:complete